MVSPLTFANINRSSSVDEKHEIMTDVYLVSDGAKRVTNGRVKVTVS